MRGYHDVAVKNGGIDLVPTNGLQRQLGCEVRLFDGVEDAAVTSSGAVFGEAAARLAHEPHRSVRCPLTVGGQEEWPVRHADGTLPGTASLTGMPASGEHHPAFEEYCECIFELDEDDVAVIQARIAERLQVSRPAVSEMIRRLDADGLITTDGAIRLTKSGEALAQSVVRRHRLAERFLTDLLGLSWADAHHEAGKWEHVMSEPVERAMARVLGSPTTCPHGNPIPGSDYEAPAAVPLVDIGPGRTFTVSRIPEELEFTPGLLDFLEASAIQPGRSGEVTAASPDGTMTVVIEGHHVGVGAFASARILVTNGQRPMRAGSAFCSVAFCFALAGCGTTVVESTPTSAPKHVTTTTEAIPAS